MGRPEEIDELLPYVEAAYRWEPPPKVYVTVYVTRWPDQPGRVHALLQHGPIRESAELSEWVELDRVAGEMQAACDRLMAKRMRPPLRLRGGDYDAVN